MNAKNLGKLIKYLRNTYNMTQEELATGICTRRHLSNIENGKVYISSYYLELFAYKLNFDIMILMNYSNYCDPVFVYTNKKKIDELTYLQQYEKMFNLLLDIEKQEDFSKSIELTKYIDWHKAIYEYKQNKHYSKAIDILNKCIDRFNINQIYKNEIKFVNIFEIELLNTYGNCMFEKGDTQLSIHIYKYINACLDSLSFSTNISLHSKLLFNLSKALYLSEYYDDSLFYIEKGLSLCRNNYSLEYLGQLYYQKAVCLVNSRSEENPIKYFLWAYNIFDMQGNEKLKNFLIKKTEDKYNQSISKYIS
ncbi:MAG: helix-turn-helix transcriptional regulator [Vallitalea sp.]|nr:helix-turn-helix transcriptional regulator [Vallitalea sp.]